MMKTLVYKRQRRGGDVVSSVISKIPTELHLRTLTGKKYNWCGPNTDLSKRLNPDKTPKDFSKPINKIDEICMKHDIAYEEADKGVGTRHEADKIMLEELNKVNNQELNWNEFIAKYITKGIIGVKYKLGLGFDEAEELHRPIRHKFKRRRVFVFNVDDIWSADLKDMQSLAKENNGYKYLLNVIDLFSKTAYSIPLKSKSSDVIIDAFEKLFANRRPKKLWTDLGSEFISNRFKKFLKDNNIELYHVYNEGKAVVVERFNRTLGEMIQKHLTARNTSRYIDVLQELINEYNNRYHTSIKMTPFQASDPENRSKVLNNLYSSIKDVKRQKPRFRVGDRVRIYRYKRTFEKGYKPNWTNEIFVVYEINETNPVTYKIKDLKEEPIIGSFYKEELSKTKF